MKPRLGAEMFIAVIKTTTTEDMIKCAKLAVTP